MSHHQWICGWLACLGICLTTNPTNCCAQSEIRFQDASASSGIVFQHFSGNTGKHFIVETVTAGLATLDYNNDGLLDVYLLNGSPLRGDQRNPPPRNRLFRNDGNFHFTDVTDQAQAGDPGFALGVVAGDYDNDGDQDLFVSNYGPSVLLENLNDGTFLRREFEHPQMPRVGAGLALLDMDHDGNLDLYIANYVKFTFEQDVNRLIYGVPAAPGPKDYEPDPDCLYRNLGNGMFEDVSDSSGISRYAGPGMGVVAFDFDEDGDTDVFVCNDSAENFLFENQADGTFVESALLAGVAYDIGSSSQASMGADVADFDHDGHADLVTTNFIDEVPTLYQNSGNGYFDDIGLTAGLGVASRSVTWGVGFGDFDNDTWPDLFIAAGHLFDGVSKVDDSEHFQAPNVVLQNQAGKKFADVSERALPYKSKVSRGIVLDDLDCDGRLDVIVLDLNDTPQVLRNVSESANNFVSLQLVGKNCSRDAAGARIKLVIGETTLHQEVLLGRGYQSHFGSILHIGLGTAQHVDSIEVHWPHGDVSQYPVLEAGSQVILRQGLVQYLYPANAVAEAVNPTASSH